MSTQRRLSSIALVACSLFPREARATVPAKVEAAGQLGYATKPSDGTINRLGVGLGFRAGVELFDRFYFGLRATWFMGGEDDQPPLTNYEYGRIILGHAELAGAQAGYSFHIRFVTIRPQVGLGEAALAQTIVLHAPCEPGFCGPVPTWTTSSTETHLYFEPTLSVLANIGIFSVGVNGELLVISKVSQQSGSEKTSVSLVTGLEAGVRF